MKDLTKLNHTIPQYAEQIRLSFEDMEDEFLPVSVDDFCVLMKFLDALENGELTNEMLISFRGIHNAGMCWKQIRHILNKAYKNSFKKNR